MTTYKWKPLTSIKIDPQAAGEELERIRVGHTDLLQAKLGSPNAASVEAYQQYGASRIAGKVVEAERNAYEQDALRRARLGKDQLALENEIARVRNDALKEGITLTEEQVKRIAEANLAGNTSRSAEGKKPKAERADEYERLAERIAETTANLVNETEVLRQLDPLVEDYGYALERARSEQDLLNAAQKAGVEITPQLREQIAALAHEYATATVEAAKLGETQDEIRRKAEEMREFQKDLTRSLVDGFIQGNAVLSSDPLTFETSRSFVVLAHYGNEAAWALLCLGVGLIRLAALVVNGTFQQFRYSPHLRGLASIASCFFWGQIALGVFIAWSLGGAGTGVVAYGTFMAIEIWNLIRAWADVGASRKAG